MSETRPDPEVLAAAADALRAKTMRFEPRAPMPGLRWLAILVVVTVILVFATLRYGAALKPILGLH